MSDAADTDCATDPWRYVCPAGHSAYEAVSDDRIWCRSCAADSDTLTATHHMVRDKKADGMIQWSELS